MSVAAANTDRETASYLRQIARYERIIEISQQLNSTLDLPNLLRMITHAATELTNSEAASILLVDPMSGELRFEQSSNLKPHEVEQIIVPMEGSIAGWVVTHGEARVIQDATRTQEISRVVDDTIQFKTRSLLAVPMRTQSKVIGCLEAVNKRHDERFNDDDIKTLTILASQAAVAIQNSRLFQQSDFMSEMVHELRTPLTALKISTTLLLKSQLTTNQLETLQIMHSETDRLIRLTNDFLDVARWESGRERLEITQFDLQRLIAESVDVVRTQAASKQIGIDIIGEPFTLQGDRGKLKQVLLNLLTNAIKYNREGGRITVRTRLSPEFDEPAVELAVIDTGYGISQDAQKNMFQKFYRVADNDKIAHGTGLGLAIARHIIEAHSGRIWLESEKDVGSTFFIALPLN